MKLALRGIVALSIASCAAHALAQGIVVDSREAPLGALARLKTLRVKTAIHDQIAETDLEQVFVNASDADTEARWLFPVPADASISAFEIWIDGKKVDGKILPADEARALFTDITRKKKDAGLLEFVGRGVLQTAAVPFKKGAELSIRVRMSEVLRAESGMVRWRHPLAAARFSAAPLEELSLAIDITSKDPIKNIYSPTHPVTAVRLDETHATAEWTVRGIVPTADFELYYGTQGGEIGANLLSTKPDKDKPGYFLLFASPKAKVDDADAEPKDVVFILDKSGSMQEDDKIQQAREALKFVLRSLNSKDRFSIVTFNEKVDVYSPGLIDYSPEEKQKALDFVSTIAAEGDTNIDEALKAGLGLFKDDARLKMILFLTDGLPTQGEQNPEKISANASTANARNVRIFDFGVGHNVNTTLLDKIARQNHGDSEYIKPGESLEAKISGFYRKIQSPVLSDLALDFGGVNVSGLQPRKLPDLFAGGQIILAGRYEGAGKTTITLEGMTRGKKQTFAYDVEFADAGQGHAGFVERIWATRRVGDIVDQIQLYGKNDELTKEIVDLGVKYGIVTEYTAFLASEETDLHNASANYKTCDGNWAGQESSGGKGFNQAQSKKAAQSCNQVEEKQKYLDAEGKEVEIGGCRNIGSKAFFLKKKVWQDSDVTDKDAAVELKFFSEEFYKALEATPALNAYACKNLAMAVKLDGKVYKFVKE